MSEERLLILKMVEEGRITAEEGAELLDALSDKEKPGTEKGEYDGWRKLEKHSEEFVQRVDSAVEKFSKNLEFKLEGGIADKLSGLPKLLAKIPFVTVLGEESHVFQDEYFGNFQANLEAIPINLYTKYGNITVEGWQQKHYKLVVTQKINAENRGIALQQVIDLDIPEKQEQVEQINISLAAQKNIQVSYHLFIPNKGPYIMQLKSNNGKCIVENLQAQDIEVNTYNGSISARKIKANLVQAIINNGSCSFDQVDGILLKQNTNNGELRINGTAEKIICESTNGSVKATLVKFPDDNTDVLLKTINGGISCTLPKQSEHTIKVNAHTAIGKIKVELENFVASLNQRHVATHQVKGETKGVETSSKTVNIDAQVSSGGITIIEDDKGNATT